MAYQEIKPGPTLVPYVKCYFTYESASDTTLEDTVFPSGCMEVIFNLGSGKWQSTAGNGFVTTPAIELWGQLTRPLAIRSIGRNTMLGIRFWPHGAARFLKDGIEQFNNQIIDYGDVSGTAVQTLHAQLLELYTWDERVALLEAFLYKQLLTADKGRDKLTLVADVMHELKQEDFFDNIENVASRYGITGRYLQKLFLKHTGLTPKLYSKIHRFQNSLGQVAKGGATLTSIAHTCGYYDQSHFIRDFRTFTGLAPSDFSVETAPITAAFSNL